MKSLLLALLVLAGLAPAAVRAQSRDAVLAELAPTGALRVGIGVGPVSSAFWATRDAGSSEPRGVTVDLGKALAVKLGVPLAFIAFGSSGELANAAETGAWDVAFMPVDDERRQKLAFGPDYVLFQSTYLVPPGSPIQRFEEVDRPGVRVFGVENTTTARSAARALKQATLTNVKSGDDIYEAARSGKADAVALGRESLESLAQKLPGARILDGSFHSTATAVAVPKGKPAALAYVTAFIEEAKASGLVRRVLDANGLKSAVVAPPK